MKKNLQTRFSTRQYMLSREFEIYYYKDASLSGVDSHSHDYYEFYLKKLKLETIYKNDMGHVLDKIRAYSIYNEFYQKLLSENSVFRNQKGIQAFISELCDIALHSNTREGKPNKNILYKLDKDIEEEFEKEI